jgi:acyl-CoA reductase-like NAD-dependent aldehyde dehydrogenase
MSKIKTDNGTEISALRESALAAAGVRGTFTNLIDGKSVGARNTLDVLDPATGELLAKVPDIERDGMDAAFAAARKAFSSWSKLTWEARRAILEKALEKVKAHREELVTLLMAEGGRPRSLALWEVAAVLDDFAPGVLSQSLPDVETTQPGVGRVTRHYAPLGVVAAISPWNLPLLLSYDKVVPALIAARNNTIFTSGCNLTARRTVWVMVPLEGFGQKHTLPQITVVV